MKLSELKDKTVLVKFADPESQEPIPVKLVGSDNTGIWFQYAPFAKELMERISKHKVAPPEFRGNPYIFIPLCHIEWMMLPDTDAH